MNEEKILEEVKNTEETEEVVPNKGKEFADSLIAHAEESKNSWDGKKLYRTLKFLILIAATLVVMLEIVFYVWPKVKHNFPENIPVTEKCKKATCVKSCNGECSCKYINVYEREETVTCIIK